MSIDVNSAAFKEWCECHATMGRMDTVLEDLRKFGFTLITGLLTASSFLGFGTNRPDAGVAAFVAVMVLVTVLFSVDTYYSAAMSGAVERALDLEADTRWQISLTQRICYNCHRAGVVWVTLGLYVALLLVALGLGVVSASTSTHASVLVMVTAGLGAALAVYMIAYWAFVARQTHLHSIKKRDVAPAVAVATAQ